MTKHNPSHSSSSSSWKEENDNRLKDNTPMQAIIDEVESSLGVTLGPDKLPLIQNLVQQIINTVVTTPTVSKLTVNSVTASGNDGNVQEICPLY